MRCPACEVDNSETHRFCSACGERLRHLCPSCGAQSAPKARFCSDCGSVLTQVEHADLNTLHGAMRDLATERKHVSLLFADLCGSLALLDRNPENAKLLLEGVLERMAVSVRKYGGVVNQVMGDGIMAMFGAPMAYEDHALRACHAALHMQEKFGEYASEHERDIVIRIGIASGEVVVGQRGRDLDAQYTAFGRVAHLAARMEQMATPGTIRIEDSTCRLAAQGISVRPLGFANIKGLDEPVRAFELLAAKSEPGQMRREGLLLPFIGREGEVALLRHALDEADAGRGRIVAVVGEPGIGKSRLMREFIDQHVGAPWRVLRAWGSSHLKPAPFSGMAQVLTDCLGLDETADRAERRDTVTGKLEQLGDPLEDHAPALLSLLNVEESEEWLQMPPVQRRRQVAQAAVAALLATARDAPVLIAVDDLQWIDADSLAIFSSLAQAIGKGRLLFLVNYRPNHSHDWHGNLNYVQIPLNSLTEYEADRFLDELLGRNEQLAELRVQLLEGTGGNPFFLEELVRNLTASGALAGTPGDYRPTADIEDLEVPATVQDVLAARIDRLPPHAKRLLQMASAIGYQVEQPVLAELSDLNERDLADNLKYLESAELLLHDAADLENQLVFRHALTHDVAYHSLLKPQRRELHRSIVAALTGLYPNDYDDRLETLAFHAQRGEQWHEALDYLMAAGKQALSRSACQRAVACFEDGLDVIGRLPEDTKLDTVGVSLRLEMRNSLMPLGRHREILPYLREAEALELKLGDQRTLAQIYSHMAHYYWLVGEWDHAIENGRKALRRAEDTQDFGLNIVTRFSLGLATYSIADFEGAITYLSANTEQLVDEHLNRHYGLFALPSVVSRGWLAWCQAEIGRFDDALVMAKESKTIADEIGRPFDRVQGLLGLGGTLLMRGEVSEAKPLLEAAVIICEETETKILLPRVAALLACAHAMCGRTKKARSLSERCVRDAESMNLTAMWALCLRWVGEVDLLTGRPDEALRVANDMLRECRRSGEAGHEAWAHYLKGAALAETASSDRALQSLGEALDLTHKLNMVPLRARILLRRAELHEADGHRSPAAEDREASTTLLHDMKMNFWLDRPGPADAVPVRTIETP